MGMEVQSLGLAAAAGLDVEVKRIPPRKLLRVAPVLGHFLPITPSSEGATLTSPWPDVVIGCGRRMAGAVLAVKRMSGGTTYSVQVQNPGSCRNLFDSLVVPEHDGVAGENVIETIGSLNNLTSDVLAEQAEHIRPLVLDLPKPWIVVNIGGNNQRYSYGPEQVEALAQKLKATAHESGGSLLVTCSRRTDEMTKTALREKLKDAHCYLWTEGEPNPYRGFLALGEAFIVTSDSVNMISEACSTGRPVLVETMGDDGRRIQAFHRSMEQRGLTRPFSGSLEHWGNDGLDETTKAGRVLRQRLDLYLGNHSS